MRLTASSHAGVIGLLSTDSTNTAAVVWTSWMAAMSMRIAGTKPRSRSQSSDSLKIFEFRSYKKMVLKESLEFRQSFGINFVYLLFNKSPEF